jgi:HAD superfamily hydrolase (TIGR01509 family)
MLKPDPRIFELALSELGADPARTVMVGDNAEADGAAADVGCTFRLVAPTPDRPADALLRAVGAP